MTDSAERVAVLAIDRVLPELLRRRLAPLGYQLDVAVDANALRAGCSRQLPRAVFVPARLPGVDLKELVAWFKLAGLRGGDAGPEAIPDPCAVILFGIDDDDQARARQVHADGFLRVPFSDSEVLDVLGVSMRARKLVLLVDDSPLIHRHTVPILEEAGYDVDSAFDGEQALARVAARRPDLVITDIEMPRLDGYGLCKRLKSSAETAHLPVLICSALGEAHDLEKGFDCGADDYLVKPVLPEELSTRIRQLLVGTMPASRERILVVDDSPAQRHYVQDCLARQGFEVLAAENGRVGLARARAHQPALIVSDYDMPEMNGFEMVLALKRDPLTRETPVIMLTARDSRRDVAQMRAAGATAYLVKPFGQDKCIATVERTLAERRLFAYKVASRPYLSDFEARAAEQRARAGDAASVRAEEREVTVMFTDICGFTQLAGKLTPREVIDLLNAYFDKLCPIVKEEGGAVDKFIGDAIMAVFDDLPGREPPPIRAVRAALAMQDALGSFNIDRTQRLEMRIGINTGTVVAGDLGPEFRREGTVIGDAVNRANRYETCCPRGKVLVSESTREALGALAECEALPGLTLKGVDAPVTGYVVRSLRT
jgi:CheY-like chemotaxis protein/class 3 adenylate cyclase